MALEQAAALDTVVLDKTGTLTRGEPEVVAVATADGVAEDEVLRLVAAAERESEHPLAEAIVKARRRARPGAPRVESFEAVPGHGAMATVEGGRLTIGNARLLDREGVASTGWPSGRRAGRRRAHHRPGRDRRPGGGGHRDRRRAPRDRGRGHPRAARSSVCGR